MDWRRLQFVNRRLTDDFQLRVLLFAATVFLFLVLRHVRNIAKSDC